VAIDDTTVDSSLKSGSENPLNFIEGTTINYEFYQKKYKSLYLAVCVI